MVFPHGELHQGDLALISHPEDRLAAYFFQHIGGRGTCDHLMCVTEMGLVLVCYLMPVLTSLRMQNPTGVPIVTRKCNL